MDFFKSESKTANTIREQADVPIENGIAGSIKYRKWLAYVPEFLEKRIEQISCKPFADLSLEDLNYYKDYFEQQAVLKELEKFFSEKRASANVEFIKSYINNHPLSEIKKMRLTSEKYNELINIIMQTFTSYSEEDILRISDELNAFNPSMSEDKKKYYDGLSMEEAFVYDFTDNLFFNQMMDSSDAISHIKAKEKTR